MVLRELEAGEQEVHGAVVDGGKRLVAAEMG